MVKQILKFYVPFFLIVLLFHLSCKKEYSCENCGINKPPVADAGPDQVIVLPTDSINLDGSNSHDPDGTITDFLWKKISGPLSNAINNTATAKTTVKDLVVGIYKFELKVTDNKGLNAKDTMQVIVDSIAGVNHPPIANAGDDVKSIYCIDRQWIGRNDTIILDGVNSTDPDNNIVAYQWTRISGPTLPALSPVNIPGHPTQIAIINLQPGTVSFELKVTDAGGLVSKDTVQAILFLNQPPVADAGAIPAITLPTNSITLDGSGSTDPENNILTYQWTKISGPSLFNIMNPSARQTQVTNLVAGSYQFELKVTDVCGKFSTDIVQVIVNPEPPACNPGNRPLINVQLIPIGNLSLARIEMTATTAGSKILFAGGEFDNGAEFESTPRVDIYDTITHVWSTAELSGGRWNVEAVTNGTKIYFSGGHTVYESYYELFDIVNVYEAASDSWSTLQLSEKRMDLASARVGNKIFFAGGKAGGLPGPPDHASNRVDVLDLSNNQWIPSANLNTARACLSAASANNKIYFIGGNTNPGAFTATCNPTNQVEIYNNTNNSWSADLINQSLSDITSIAVGNKIYMAGGQSFLCNTTGSGPSSRVEIRDAVTGDISYCNLFEPRVKFDAGVKDGKIIFFTGQSANPDKFDIYDPATNSWSIGVLPPGYTGTYASMVVVNNTIYVAGLNGPSTQVWKLEF